MIRQPKTSSKDDRLPDHYYKTENELLEMLAKIIANNKKENEKKSKLNKAN